MKLIKIVLVDDHSLIRDAIRAHLSAENYQIVAEAGNSKEALAIIEKHRPDIVFMDITCPGRTGSIRHAKSRKNFRK